MPLSTLGASAAARGGAAEGTDAQRGYDLVVVGTGIQVGTQTTEAARQAIVHATAVLYAASDTRTAAWITRLNPAAKSLPYPRDGRPRRAIYADMVERVLVHLRPGARVCAAFYGSPAVFATPAHLAIRRARAAGFRARMLPGVSFLDCLFSDLNVDPGDHGCFIVEAAALLMRPRPLDPHAHLVLAQIGLIANRAAFEPNQTLLRSGLMLLAQRLAEVYPARHPAVLYEASQDPGREALAQQINVAELADAEVSAFSTLYVPPVGEAAVNPAVMHLLGGDQQPSMP